MKNNHEPDSAFLEKLQWQLESEGRRLHRLHNRTGRVITGRNLMLIGIIVLSVFSGFFASSTAAYFKDTSQRQLLLAKQEIRIRQHESHHKLLQVRQRDIMKQIDVGLLPPEEGDAVNSDLVHSEIALNRLKLDYEEIEISGRPPQNDLSAPLFGGRDFVTERLQLERMELQENVRYLEHNLKEVQRKVNIGLLSPAEIESVNLDMRMAQLAIDTLDRKIELRSRYLEENISAKQVDLMGMISETEEKLEALEAHIAWEQGRLAALEKRFAAGVVEALVVLDAQSRIDTARAEHEMVQIELKILRNNLE